MPGHGPVAGPEVIDEVLGYLYFVRDPAEPRAVPPDRLPGRLP